MKLKTLSTLAATLGLTFILTGCNDPYHSPAYASVTLSTPLHSRPHYPQHRRAPHWKPAPHYTCRGRGCRTMPPRHRY